MKLTPPVIAGIVVAIIVAYVVYNEWRKKRIAEEKANIMAEIANTQTGLSQTVNTSQLTRSELASQQLPTGLQSNTPNTALGGLGGLSMA